MDFPGHFQHIFKQLNHQRLHAHLCDCVVVVGGQSFQAHRSILAACSSHFRALLSPSVMELDPEVVTPEAFSTLLDMIYTSTLSLGASNVMDVLLAASHLHLNNVVKACKLHLSKKNFPASPPKGWRSVQQQQPCLPSQGQRCSPTVTRSIVSTGEGGEELLSPDCPKMTDGLWDNQGNEEEEPSESSSSLVFPVTSVPLQQLLPTQNPGFSDTLILHPTQNSLAGFLSGIRPGLSLETPLIQSSRAGKNSGATAFRRIAPKVPPGSETGTDPSSSSGSAVDRPPLTRASEDVLSKCKKAAAEDHVLLVEGEKKYACKICCKTFMNLTDCKKHIRVHTGEKPYPCPKCGKRFTRFKAREGEFTGHFCALHTTQQVSNSQRQHGASRGVSGAADVWQHHCMRSIKRGEKVKFFVIAGGKV
uniref:Zinc finger and BTB domain-containing protein 5-like n=1 Tax=Mastacembelus armatus TaxID=205130 RepID=A0A7N8WIY4_9TELE